MLHIKSKRELDLMRQSGKLVAQVLSQLAAMAGEGVNLAADLVQFAADTDSEYVNKLFIPGLRRAGDFHAASVMSTQGRALIYNAGPQFPADWARQAANAAGSERYDAQPCATCRPDCWPRSRCPAPIG